MGLLKYMALAVVLVSCGTPKTVVLTEKVEVETVVVERDTVFQIMPDTASFQALIKCQEDRAVMVAPQLVKPSKTITPKVSLSSQGVLQVDCTSALQELRAKLRDKQTVKTITKEVPVYVPTSLSGWQWFQIWCGRLFLLLFLGLGIGFILKATGRA